MKVDNKIVKVDQELTIQSLNSISKKI